MSGMRLEASGALQAALEERIGHHFAAPALLAEALLHPSFRNERPEVRVDNQRLEFLGDAALALIVGEHLYRALPGRDEGQLTMLRARVVCAAALARVGRELQVGAALRLGRGERQTGGADRDSVLADAVEAVVGAVYLDAGAEAARALVLRLFATELAGALAMATQGEGRASPALLRAGHGWKALLQQRAQADAGALPSYHVVATSGPDHARRFVIEVQAEIGGVPHRAVGEGATKRAAEAAAARAVVLSLGGDDVAERAGGGTTAPSDLGPLADDFVAKPAPSP